MNFLAEEEAVMMEKMEEVMWVKQILEEEELQGVTMTEGEVAVTAEVKIRPAEEEAAAKKEEALMEIPEVGTEMMGLKMLEASSESSHLMVEV